MFHNSSKCEKAPKSNLYMNNSSLLDTHISCPYPSTWDHSVMKGFLSIILPAFCVTGGTTCPASQCLQGVAVTKGKEAPSPLALMPCSVPMEPASATHQMDTDFTSSLWSLHFFPTISCLLSFMIISHLLQWLLNLADHVCHLGSFTRTHWYLGPTPPGTLSW